MDGGSFYSGNQRSNSYSGIVPHRGNASLPRLPTGATPGWFPDHMCYPHASPAPETAMSQKLDYVVTLLEAQGKEIEIMRAESAALKADVARLNLERSSSSMDTPPSTKKLLTELSVR